MKKILLALAAVAMMATSANAQKPELYFGYGGYTMMDGCDMHCDAGKVSTAWGAVTAGLNFKVMPKFALGVSYTFSSSELKHFDNSVYYNVILFNGKYDYYRNGGLTMYGHVGIGVDISTVEDYDTKAYFACQISPIGAQFKLNNSASLFGEVGWGAQGVLQVGFRFNL